MTDCAAPWDHRTISQSISSHFTCLQCSRRAHLTSLLHLARPRRLAQWTPCGLTEYTFPPSFQSSRMPFPPAAVPGGVAPCICGGGAKFAWFFFQLLASLRSLPALLAPETLCPSVPAAAAAAAGGPAAGTVGNTDAFQAVYLPKPGPYQLCTPPAALALKRSSEEESKERAERAGGGGGRAPRYGGGAGGGEARIWVSSSQ